MKNNSIGSLALLTVAMASCAPASDGADEMTSAVVGLLAAGQPVFGIFSGEHTAEQGAVMAQNRETDFVFYSLESGPFDIPTMTAYKESMAEASGEESGGARPMALRIPPIGEGEEAARDHVRQGLAAGVEAIVVPHLESAAQAAVAVSAMGPDAWPGNPGGHLVTILIVEDKVGVANVREIVSTPGVGVVFAGPGDLRRAYERDMEAVENAIQPVLAACKEFEVPCGITAGVDDIAERLEQGFRVIIVTQPEALAVGRQAAGRTGK